MDVPIDAAASNRISQSFRNWLKEPSFFWLEAFSYLHSVRMPELHAGPRVKPKQMAEHYWGSVGLFESNLVWGAASLHDHAKLVIPYEWVDWIFVDPGLRPATVRFGPPPTFGLLIVQVSPRKLVNMPIVEFPGTRYADLLDPVHDGKAVIWGFAVNLSSGVHLLDRLHRHLTEKKDLYGPWELEGEGLKRGLMRVEEDAIDLRVDGPPEPGEYSLLDLIADEMTDEEFRRFNLREDVSAEEESVFCGQCGVKNPMSSNFCAKCGSKLVKL